MFYSQFILAKKGPLGTIWIAAHLERKLRKNQVADTDIGVSVDSILFPDVPIALRLSSHLLLGVVRIYSRKVSYLFDDCSEALLKIKQAFRSTAVDLPPEESTAPYHSITLPETFDLDDFELPDNDMFQGNYVDHHISTREQITLQDSMEGVAYSTSQFGLDERFGDGDASQVGLDLEEDLFIDKVEVPGHDDVSDADPQASVKSMTKAETDKSCNSPCASDAVQVNGTINKVKYLAANSEFIDFAQAPSTPGLVEESNLSNVQKGLTCDNHLELDDHNTTENGTERAENASTKSDINQREDNTYLSMVNNLNHDIVVCMPPAENGCLSGDLEINQAKGTEPINKTGVEIADSNKLEVTNSGSIYNTEPRHTDIHREDGDCGNSIEGSLSKTGDEVTNSIELCDRHDKSIASTVVCPLEQPGLHGLGNTEAKACQDLDDPETLKRNLDNEPSTSSCISVLRSYNSYMNPPDISSSSCGIHNDAFHGDLRADDVLPCSLEVSGVNEVNFAPESLKKMQGEECRVTDGVQPEDDQILEPVLSAKLADGGKQDDTPDNAFSNDNQAENLNSSMTSELPAPEKLLSAPQILVDKPEDLLVEATAEKEILEGSDGSSAVTKTSGRKRSYAESSLTVQSLNSVESFGMTKSKTINSVPDDDDLLSSILVGRRSSVLKLKPTPVLEVISAKRVRSASRPSVSKRKVLMDDSMVLLGDTIRQQLTNTEDIRRLRKKAPCTRTEILMIQRQFLEEEIFTEPVLSGLSAGLTCLHSKKIDLRGIKISENDVNIASSQASKDKECSTEPLMQHNEIEGSSGTMTCRNDVNGEDLYLGSSSIVDNRLMDAIADVRPSENETLEQVADMELQSANAETGESTKKNVIQGEISGDFCNMAPGFVDQSDLLAETISHDADALIMPSDKLDTQVIETVSEGTGAGMGLDGLQTSDHCTGDVGAAGNELRGEEISFEESKVDASTEVREDVQVNRLAPNGDAENFPVSAHDEADNSAIVHEDQVLGDIGTEKLVVGNDGDDAAMNLGCDDKEQMSDLLGNECSKIDSSYLAELDGDLNRVSLNDRGDSVCEETDQQRTVNEEIDHFATRHSGDFQDDEFAHDTEFLNVDDDEAGEDDEDDMAGKDDVQVLENSGWSSRTRAVAKYLQTIFDEETGHGRKVISMDNLLANKTRKEASRMFFETLVLKTRDYIHVEQEIPFESISLKPRAKLSKSIF